MTLPFRWEVFSKTQPSGPATHRAEPSGSPLRVRTLRVRVETRGVSTEMIR